MVQARQRAQLPGMDYLLFELFQYERYQYMEVNIYAS